MHPPRVLNVPAGVHQFSNGPMAGLDNGLVEFGDTRLESTVDQERFRDVETMGCRLASHRAFDWQPRCRLD